MSSELLIRHNGEYCEVSVDDNGVIHPSGRNFSVDRFNPYGSVLHAFEASGDFSVKRFMNSYYKLAEVIAGGEGATHFVV